MRSTRASCTAWFGLWLQGSLSLSGGILRVSAFSNIYQRQQYDVVVSRKASRPPQRIADPWTVSVPRRHSSALSSSPLYAAAYVPQDGSTPTPKATSSPQRLYPNIGDVCRFYDLDGGKSQGQVLVGRISFISPNLGNEGSGWTVELTPLDDVGDGYYTDYPFQKRRSQQTTRDLADVSPIAASFVRSEDAYKVPMDTANHTPRVRAETYDIVDYPGPFAGDNAIDQTIVETDAVLYSALKSRLLRYTALAGLAGTAVAEWVQGPEDAVIYAAGVVASVAYLFLLTVQTDTVASAQAKLGARVSKLRFAMPLIVLAGVALYNQSRREANPVAGLGLFSTVTPEQFGAAVLGFLTYRIPLFLTQVQDAVRDETGDMLVPGSAGIAMKLAQSSGKETSKDDATALVDDVKLATVFLVSGPQATGRTALVQRLVEQGDGKFVQPSMVDRVKDPAVYERLEMRNEFLTVDASERYGMTKQGIVSVANSCGSDAVVVIDADVDLARKLRNVAGLRLVGVWVGLDSVDAFEDRIGAMVDAGAIEVPPDGTRDSVVRAKIREVVQEIEFGISSGLFEFTILNRDEDDSLKQLREAAAYCFL